MGLSEQHSTHDLFEDELLELILGEVVLVLVEVEELFGDGCSGGLIFGIVVWLKVRVLESFVNGDTLDRVEGEKLLEQIEGQVRSLGKHGLERDLLLEGKRADVLASTARLDAIVIFHGGSAKNIKDERKLMVVILAGEKWLATQHLRQDTTNTPNINGLGVLLESQHNLGSTVPTSGNVFGHEARVVFSRCSGASQAKVADLEVTIGIEQKIRRLQITMKDIGRVHGLESSESLIDKVLAVVIRQVLSADDPVHVGLHKLLNQVNFTEALIASWLLNVQDRNDVLMIEVTKQLHLTQGSQTEHGMIKRSDLLDSDLLTRRLMKGRADNSISTFTNDILNVILLANIE